MKNYLLWGGLLFALYTQSPAQPPPFNLYLEPLTVDKAGGLQSYAFGQAAGKWLILGGRLDGLHRRQPFATFDLAGHNTRLIVIDPIQRQSWSAPLSSLSPALQEQLSATNMEFHQEGDYLYVVGGYGYSPTAADHTTYPYLTAIEVPAVIDAIIHQKPFQSFFRQYTDPQFAVTGGRLVKIEGVYHLVGGQRFVGRYNPMGPTHGPGFMQEYTNQIRKFKISDDGRVLNVTHLPAFTDAQQLHRRDYNVAPQIMPDGREGATAFSGVFQTTVDLPYLNCVDINSDGYLPVPGFTQYYNHYHCAFIPFYSAQSREMHTVFFGGIAQFYDSLGMLVQDNNVPFVRTIARVTRDAKGNMAEYKMPVDMPDWLGAGAEFIPLESVSSYPNGVLQLDALPSDTTLVGYIYGGIVSSAPNIFWVNTGAESKAGSQIYKVFLVKNTSTATHTLNGQSTGRLKMQVFPNPNNGQFSVKFQLDAPVRARLSISDVRGVQLLQETLDQLHAGENLIAKKFDRLSPGSAYLVTLETDRERVTLKVSVQE